MQKVDFFSNNTVSMPFKKNILKTAARYIVDSGVEECQLFDMEHLDDEGEFIYTLADQVYGYTQRWSMLNQILDKTHQIELSDNNFLLTDVLQLGPKKKNYTQPPLLSLLSTLPNRSLVLFVDRSFSQNATKICCAFKSKSNPFIHSTGLPATTFSTAITTYIQEEDMFIIAAPLYNLLGAS